MSDHQAAERWLKNHGRPIDKALLDFEKNGDSTPILDALSPYRNSDGGFGHALEPDIRLDQSSVIATTVALQLLNRCQADDALSLVQGAMTYMRSNYNAAAKTWAIVPPAVVEAAHAPWWEPKELSEYLLNPRAEIVGYMYQWPGYFADDLRNELTNDVFELVCAADSMEMHDLLVVERMVHTRAFPRVKYKDAVERFYALAESTISTDPAEWSEYGLTPLTVIKDPHNPLAARLKKPVLENLKYLSRIQQADGSWAPRWSWFGHYEDEWPEAERDIRSMITADSLCLLRRFEHYT